MQRGGGGLKKIEGSKQFRNVPMEFGPEGRVIQNVWLQGSFNGSVSRVCFKVCFKGLFQGSVSRVCFKGLFQGRPEKKPFQGPRTVSHS